MLKMALQPGGQGRVMACHGVLCPERLWRKLQYLALNPQTGAVRVRQQWHAGITC